MDRRYSFGGEDNYRPSQFSPRVKSKFAFDENDERFNPVKPKIGFMPEPEEEPEEDPDPYGYGEIISRYRKELGGEQPALAKYRTAIQNTPQQQDYDLGKWGKLGAALSGFGAGYQDPAKGIAVARSLREAPWQRALKQHETDVNNLGTEAEFEQKDRAARMKGLDMELDTVKNRRTADREAALAKSTILRQGTQNRNETGRLDMDISNTDADNERADAIARVDQAYKAGLITVAQKNAETNRINAGTNQYNAGSTRMNAITNQGQLGVSQQNAAINSFNAGTSRYNADTTRKRFEFDSGPEFERNIQNDMFNHYMDEKEEAGRNTRDLTGSASYIAPNAQSDAMDSAALDIHQNLPQYRKFLKMDPKSGYIRVNPELTPQQLADPAFIEFKQLLTGKAKKIMNTTRGGQGGSGRYQFESQ